MVRPPPLDVEEFERWTAQGDRAFATARLAAGGEQHDWACFLCEQGAQLWVKGLLHAIGAEAWGHDLVRLVDRAGLTNDVGSPAARLSRHYIPSRYPDAHPSGPPGDHYGESDSATAMDDALSIVAAVRREWEALSASGGHDAP
jgi:HEPN domain-containing protein